MTDKVEDTVETTGQPTTHLDLPPGVPPLRSLYLYVAGSCNLACRHCWITPTLLTAGNGNSGKFVKLEHVEKAIHEALPLGIRSVKLTGGEPTLHPRFREIVDLIDRASLEIIIETNGTLVDLSLAQFLKERRTCFISVSLDGATAETHDALRMAKGSYDQAIRGIQNLVEAGFHPQMICTLHRGNVSQIAEVIALAESLQCGSVKFNHVQLIGRGERFADENGLAIEEVIQAYQHLEREILPHSKIRIQFDIPFAFHSIHSLLKGSLSHCTVLNILGMLSSGELSLCGVGVNFPELIYGNIECDDLAEVWLTSPGLASLREQIPAKLEGVCGQCLHRDLCLGQCVAHNYHDKGRLNAPYNFCDRAEEMGLFPDSRKIDV